MRVFLYEDNFTTTCIKQQFDAVYAWARSSVANVNFFNVPALKERILLGMRCLTCVQSSSRSSKVAPAGDIGAVGKATWNTIVAGGKDVSSNRDKNTSHAPSSTRRARSRKTREFKEVNVS